MKIQRPYPREPEDVSDWFWSIIERAEGRRESLAAILKELPKDEVRRFAREFYEASYRLWDDDYLIYTDEPSEDGILTTGQWVVSQGKEYYMDLIAHPHKTPTEQDIDKRSNLAGVADRVYWERYREELEWY